MGNTDKRLEGSTGPGEGDWRLELTSTLELQVLTYIRTDDGFLTSMHDLVPETEAGHRVAIFNPGRLTNQVSELRLVNPAAEAAEVTIMGIDGDSPSTPVVLLLPAGASRTLTAQELESGDGEGVRRGARHGRRQMAVGGDGGSVRSGDEPAVESDGTPDQSVHRTARDSARTGAVNLQGGPAHPAPAPSEPGPEGPLFRPAPCGLFVEASSFLAVHDTFILPCAPEHGRRPVGSGSGMEFYRPEYPLACR